MNNETFYKLKAERYERALKEIDDLCTGCYYESETQVKFKIQEIQDITYGLLNGKKTNTTEGENAT